MKFIVGIALMCLSFFGLHSFVIATKEEPKDVMPFRPLPPRFNSGPIAELLSIISPGDLHPLCANVEGIYDRLLKRGPTFNAWGGKKRTVPMSLLHDLYGKRNSPGPQSNFNPWGGKRGGDVEDDILNRSIMSFQQVETQAGSGPFASWGG